MRIGNRQIGGEHPCYLIAEMSGNHGGDIERAKEIIRQAKAAGADAVKIQVYRPDTITLNSDKEDFLIPAENAWAQYQNLYNLYEYAHTPWEWIPQLIEMAQEVDIEIFGSVFDLTSVEFMEQCGCAAYKIASPEINDIPLLRVVAATGKPVILSTGLADLADLELAVDTLRESGCEDIVLLKCTTAYPAPAEEANLRTIPNLSETFGCLSGLSDHTVGAGVPVAAVALGAVMVEKHFTLEDEERTVDSFFSLTPSEFGEMVDAIRTAEQALGGVVYGLTQEAVKNRQGRRSLYISAPIKAGERFSKKNIKSVRPGYGLSPKYYDQALEMRAARDLQVGERLVWDVMEKES